MIKKYFFLILSINLAVLFLFLNFSPVAHAAMDATASPPFFNIVPCPSCASVSEPVISGGETAPSAGETAPSAAETSVAPAPSTNPCSSDNAVASDNARKKKSKHHKHKGKVSSSFESLLNKLLEIIKKLLSMLGGSSGEIPSLNVNSTQNAPETGVTPCGPSGTETQPSTAVQPGSAGSVPSTQPSLAQAISPALSVSPSPSEMPVNNNINWAGYSTAPNVSTPGMPTNGTFTADWTIVPIDCSAGNGWLSQWVGQGGVGANNGSGANADMNLPQLGTADNCSGQTVGYSAWTIAMYGPKPPPFVDPPNPVGEGDKMTAKVVFQGGGKFATTISDITKGWTFNTPMTYDASYVPFSGEAITESYYDTDKTKPGSFVVIPKHPDVVWSNVFYLPDGKQQIPLAQAPNLLRHVLTGNNDGKVNIDTLPINGSTFTTHWVAN